MGDRALINQSYGGRQSLLDGEAIQSSMGGAQGSGGTPTPTFTVQPLVSPSSGTAGTTTFTATPGTVSNGSITSRAWLLNGSSISTGTTAAPATEGTLTYQEFATGAGGSASSAVQSVAVAAAGATGGTSASRYSFAGTRMRWPTVSRTITTNNFFVGVFYVGTPDYDITNPEFFAPAFITQTGGQTTGAEVANANDITIEGISVKVGGTWFQAPPASFPIVISGSSPGVLLPAIPVTIPAGSVPEFRMAYTVTVNGALPCTPRASSGIGTSGRIEFTQGSTTSLAAKLTDNSAVANTNGHNDGYQPAYMVAQGGDGRPSILVPGDSICYGQNEGNLPLLWDNRGSFGYISRGLDSTASGTKRIAHFNTAIPGQAPGPWTTRANWSKKLDGIKAVADRHGGVLPFDIILNQHGQNSLGAVTAPQFVQLMKDYYTFLKTEWPGKPIVQVELLSRPGSTDGFATLANQTLTTGDAYPNGSRWVFNAAVGVDGAASASTEMRTGGFIDDSFAPWLRGAFDTGSNRAYLKVLPFTTTIAVAAVSGATTLQLAANPGVGTYLNFGSGLEGLVQSVTGSGPYTCVMGMSGTPHAFTVGDPVNAKMHDLVGTHPGTEAHRDYYPLEVLAWKTRRGWTA